MATRIQNLQRLRRKLGLLTKEEKKATRRQVKRALVNIQNGARRRVKVDRGDLRNSITHEVAPGGLSGRAGTNKVHGPVVEFGRRPGQKMPPVKEIEDWAVRKGLDKSLGFPIARKIAIKGTKPAPFLFPAFERERPRFVKRLARALDKAHRDVSRS